MKKVSYFLLGLLFVVLLTVQAYAQPSKGGTPPSFSIQSSTDIYEEKIVAPIDIDQAIQEDAVRGGALWAGRSIQVDYNMSNSGTWTVMPDGTKIWRLKITTSGAKAVGLAYDHFYIPKGGKLFIYNEYRTQILGAYDETTNPSGGLFSTELVQGSIVNIEYVAPKILPEKPIKNEFKGKVEGDRISPTNFTIKPENPRIDISELIYVYRNVPFLDRYDITKTTGFGASGSCEVNVNCSPEGDNWQTEKRGVAEIWLKNGTSWGWCTGGLVNTTNNSGIPYFLTADHCHGLPDAGEPYASAADMNQWQFYFNYESATCANPGTEPAYNTIIGCVLKACSPLNGGSDFCLVQLNTAPPQSYHPYYNGWDRSNTPATSGVGIHHPAGDIKKISTFTATATSATFNGGAGMVSATNAEWNVLFVATANGHGVVEGGSSGSPLFNQSKRVVGQLSGGNSACTNLSGSNLYGKFWYDWDQTPGGTTTQLKTWLDPVNSGSTTVNGYDPFNGYPVFMPLPLRFTKEVLLILPILLMVQLHGFGNLKVVHLQLQPFKIQQILYTINKALIEFG